ncbi:MAG: VIT1/CCC1 transporter family protein [Solirubrobacteraceae bacterium]|nr:VIT1/CCC1 transporter family protein [Solirubrobacteraceae bacterium]
MTVPRSSSHLNAEHSPEAIARRLAAPRKVSYLRDFIYGAIDGTVTTFAVVAGATGAKLGATVVVIMGLANLLADGLSMAVSNYLGTRAEQDQRARARRREQRHVRLVPEGEREEIRQLFAAKGFAGDDLERIVEVITADEDRWLDTMMVEELGYGPDPTVPWRAAAATFAAFITVGLLPLLPFLLDAVDGDLVPDPFAWSAALTAGAFFAVGSAKARVVGMRWWRSGLETLLVGGAAAAVAYLVGVLLERVV